MKTVKFKDFKGNVPEYFAEVGKEKSAIIVANEDGRKFVVMDYGEFASITETLHLLSSSKNAERINKAIAEMKSGISFSQELIEA